MKKTLLTICACILATLGFGQAWNYPWAIGVGSTNDDDQDVRMAIDSQDNVYMAVEYEGPLSIGGTDYPAPADDGRDVLVVKISPEGDVLWSGSIAGDGQANGFLFGDLVNAIHIDQDDNAIVIGNIGSNGTVFGNPNGLTNNRNYVIKISPEGEVLWEVYADDDYLNDEFTAITSDENGDLYLTTRSEENMGFYAIGGVLLGNTGFLEYYYTLAKITATGTVEYVELLPTGVPTRIQLDSNGDFIIGSQYGQNEVGNYALHKISASDFSTIWARENLGNANDEPFGGNLGFHVKSDNSIVQFLKTTGQIEYSDSDVANCDMFCSMGVLVNIDADGNTVSTHTMEEMITNPELLGITSLNFFPADFKALDDDNYYIAGRLFGDVEFTNGYTFEPSDWYLGDFGNPQDAFVIKVDDNLNISEYASQTGTASQIGMELAVFSNGDAALGGVYHNQTFGGLTGNTVFGEDELSGFGGEDYFLARVVTGTEAPLSNEFEEHSLAFELFPNPSSDNINIRYLLTEDNEARFEIIDMAGKVVLSDRIGGKRVMMHQIKTSSLARGVYSLRLTTEKSIGIKSFIVNR